MSITKLEQLAQGMPTYENNKWKKVVEIFDRMPASKQAGAVIAFEKASEHWPSRVDGWSGINGSPDYEMRRAPLHWVKEVYTGNHQPKHRLIRILESPRRPLRDQKLPQVISPDAELRNVAQVGFDQVKPPGTFLKLFKGDGPWQHWKVFRLWYCELKPTQLKLVAKIDWAALESLVLTQNWIRADGAKALAKAPGLEGLKALHLGLNGIGLEGAQHLAGASWLRSLERINLEYNELSDEAFTCLAADGALSQMRELHMPNNPLGRAPESWLGELPNLELLDIEQTGFNEAGLSTLISKLPETIKSVKVDNTPFTDAHAQALVDTGIELTGLDIVGTQLTEAGVTTLLQAPSMQKLERIRFGNGFGKAHLKQIADGALPKLKWFWWLGTETEDGLMEVTKADPRLAKLYPY